MKFVLATTVLTAAIAQQAEEDNTMLQIGEHVHTAPFMRPKKRGRVALNTFCKNFCKVDPDTQTFFNQRRGGNPKNRRACVEKDAVLQDGAWACVADEDDDAESLDGCNRRHAMCANTCRERGGMNGVGVCSRRAGMNSHLCDDFSLEDMQLVLQRHCTKTCRTMTKKGKPLPGPTPGSDEADLCTLACEADGPGRYAAKSDAATDACATNLMAAWRCQADQCAAEVDELNDVNDRCTQKNGRRVPNRCRLDGEIMNQLKTCTDANCAGMRRMDDTYAIRDKFYDTCGPLTTHGDRFECLLDQTRLFQLAGNDLSTWLETVGDVYD